MPRPRRIHVTGALYHTIARGNYAQGSLAGKDIFYLSSLMVDAVLNFLFLLNSSPFRRGVG
jgi:hypothetical protein